MTGSLLAKLKAKRAKLHYSLGDYLNSLKSAHASALGQIFLPGWIGSKKSQGAWRGQSPSAGTQQPAHCTRAIAQLRAEAPGAVCS